MNMYRLKQQSRRNVSRFIAITLIGILATTNLQIAAQEITTSDFAKTQQEGYWYSRYNLGQIATRSGLGIHMLWGPMFNGDMDKLQDTVMMFAEMTGHAMPVNPFPIFLEFTSGKPYFTQQPNLTDYGTLRWDPETFDQTIITGAIGQSAMKKVLWVEQFLRATYDPPENRFEGFVLTGEVVNAFQFLMNNMTNTGEPLDLANYQGEYFPHAFSIDLEPVTMNGMMLPPKPVKISIIDSDSYLSDQWAILWATTEMARATVHPEIAPFFSGQPFPPDVTMLSMGLSSAIFANIQSRHYNSAEGTLVDVNINGNQMGSKVTLATAASALTGIGNFYLAFDGDPAAIEAKDMITSQANFLLQLQGTDGSFPNEFNLDTGNPSTSAVTLLTQAAVVNALLVANDITGDDRFFEAAIKGFDFMEKHLWDDDNGVYRSSVGAEIYKYTPQDVGVVTAAMRNLFVQGDDLAAHRGSEFWKNVVDNSGMIQSELQPTGEIMGDGVPDSDEDGILKPGAAMSSEAPFGIAPVLAGEVQLNPATGEWSVTDTTFYTEMVMFASNEMYISGVPMFAPTLVDLLSLRSMTPIVKTDFKPLEEALQQHNSLVPQITSTTTSTTISSTTQTVTSEVTEEEGLSSTITYAVIAVVVIVIIGAVVLYKRK